MSSTATTSHPTPSSSNYYAQTINADGLYEWNPADPLGCRLVESLVEMDAELAGIANRHLFINTLDTRGSDSLDFHDVGVASVRSALEAAFAAGQAAFAAAQASA